MRIRKQNSSQVEKQIKHMHYLSSCFQKNIENLREQASEGLRRRVADLINMTVTCTNILQSDKLWPNIQLDEYVEKGLVLCSSDFLNIFEDIFNFCLL